MELIYLFFMEEQIYKARILTSYYKFKQGGLCTRLLRTINALLESGHQVHFLAVEPFPISHPNYKFHKFPWPFNNSDSKYFWAIYIILSPIYLSIICYKHKITHLFVFDIIYAFVMQFARFLFNLPLSIFVRADSIENHKIKNKSKLFLNIEHLIEKNALRKAKIFCVSKSLVSSIKERNKINDSNIIYFPNDIKIESIEKNNLNPENVSIGCVGVYEERKNQIFLINIMHMLNRNNWVLNLYGEGPLRKILGQKIKEVNLDEKIILRGWISRRKLWEEIDLLLMPSKHEGAPNSILEAMGACVPVLASDIPEHREILPDTNLVSIDDLNAWVNRLEEILLFPKEELKILYENQIKYKNKYLFDWDEKVVSHIMAS